MCDPKTLFNLNLANTGLKAGTTAMQARYEADALRQNAILAERQASRALKSGVAEGSQITDAGRQLAGTQRVAMAANNVDPGSSRSAMALLTDTAYLSELDAGTTRDNAQQTADALKIEAAQKKADRKNLKRMAPLAVGSGILTGGSRAYGIHKKMTG